MPSVPKESRRVTREWAESLGWVEGEHFYVNHSGTVISLIQNEDRACDICSRPRRAAQYYSALHRGCRACLRRARDGISVDSPLIKAREIDLADSSAGQETVAQARNRVQAHDKELATRVLARRRLVKFVERFHPGYMAGWIHKDICRRLERFLERVAQGLSPRLLLFCPPRLGKSLLSSQYFPAFALGHYPEFEIIAASYNITLPIGFSRRIRELLRDPSYASMFAKTKLSDESQAVESWRTTAGGGYTAAGVGTGITGKGCHILIVDDPIKDWEAADSAMIREGTWEWYLSTAYTRIAPGGGVLGIQCLTGDTLITMADGSETALRDIRAGDAVATFDDGRLATSTVLGHKSSGRDEVYKITTASGRAIRANERHPFLVESTQGELVWVRLKNLQLGQRIVTVKGSGGSTKARAARPTAATNPQNVEASAIATTVSGSGLPGTALRPQKLVQSLASALSSSITTVSTWLSTTAYWLHRTVSALSARYLPRPPSARSTGSRPCVSTMTTTPVLSGACYATHATSQSSGETLSRFYKPLSDTSDFTSEDVVSIEPVGEEEVFDVMVERTENFVSNGLVTHNTRWNDDDWAGRIVLAMDSGDGEHFEVVSYPAINETGDEYLLADDSIAQIAPGLDVPDGAQLLRVQNSALHPERYSLEHLLRIQKNFKASGNTRMWSALYQQNPVPEEGAFFRKDMMKYISYVPETRGMHVYQAWDFAITEKKQNDWIVGYCIMQDEKDNIYELDMVRFKSDDTVIISDAILDFQQKWNAWLVGFEDGQIWKATKAILLRRCSERGVALNFETLTPLTDKLVRAGPLRGRMQMGKMYFQQEASYGRERDNELLRFPAGKHDDIVDAAAWAMRLTLAHAPPRKPEPKKIKGWRDKLAAGTSGASHMAA